MSTTQAPLRLPSAKSLREQHSKIWDHDETPYTSLDNSIALRTHRAISWVERAEQEYDPDNPEEGDPDAAFVFYWIAFNALYAVLETDVSTKRRPRSQELDHAKDFLEQIHPLDGGVNRFIELTQRLSESSHSSKSPIEDLLQNEFVFRPFWEQARSSRKTKDWKKQLDNSNEKTERHLENQEPLQVMLILVERLYTLRNQLFHGGATWNSSLNREAVNAGFNILRVFVPTYIELMLNSNGAIKLGDPYFSPYNRDGDNKANGTNNDNFHFPAAL